MKMSYNPNAGGLLGHFKKLLVTRASLLGTRALLLVVNSYSSNALVTSLDDVRGESGQLPLHQAVAAPPEASDQEVPQRHADSERYAWCCVWVIFLKVSG